MSKEEYIELVKTDRDARNAALAVAWVLIKVFPALESVMEEFKEAERVLIRLVVQNYA